MNHMFAEADARRAADQVLGHYLHRQPGALDSVRGNHQAIGRGKPRKTGRASIARGYLTITLARPKERSCDNPNVPYWLSIMHWTVETLNTMVDEELEILPDDMRARFVRISELIESEGLHKVGPKYVKPLKNKLWEIRLSGRSGVARALYVTAYERRVIVVRVFVKKTQKTPQREIVLALQRAKEVTQ